MKGAGMITALLALLSTIGVSQDSAAIGEAPQFTPLKRVPVQVVLVKDGDTVQVREFLHDIRIASIDAPESAHARRRPGQPFGAASKKTLIEVLGKAKRVEAYCYEKDRYQRPVCDVYADGQSVGRTLVANGLAWANQSGAGRYLRDKQLLKLQADARSRKAGLWADFEPVEPWVWRDRCWKEERCD